MRVFKATIEGGKTGYRAYGNRGYAAEDARAIAASILLLVSVK